MFELTADQQNAVLKFSMFMLSSEKEMVISGGAGVGKTTLLNHLMNSKDPNKIYRLLDSAPPIREWRLTATTNKAAEVLQQATGRETRTIHSLLGLKVINDFDTGDTKIKRTSSTEIIHDSLIVVDECSMIDRDLHRFIDEGTMNCKILYVGDHCQLAPVKEKISPVFATNDPIVLNEVVRSKGAPAITALCEQLRETVETGVFRPIQAVSGYIDYLDPEEAQTEIERAFLNTENPDARILCYTNSQVHGFNNYLRNKRGLPKTFLEGERLVSNAMTYGLYSNKSVLRIEEDVHVLEIQEHDDILFKLNGEKTALPVYIIRCNEGSFLAPTDPDDYQLALKYLAKEKNWIEYYRLKEQIADLRPRDACTVYKAQGSTYHTVFVHLGDIGRCTNPSQAARMLYVACSRPTNRICLLGQLPPRFSGE